MSEQIGRRELARSGLSQEAMQAALDIAGLRPGAAEWRAFELRVLRFGGVLSLAAGMIFLIAFNWENLGLYVRFAMVELPLLFALVVAWVKGVESLSGKLALILAVLLTGALLALFGQTYQTGADVYQLFLGWAALSLPWVIACRYAPCWALWLLVVNTAVTLYGGVAGHGWLMGIFSDRSHWSPWSLPFLLDLLLYGTVVALSRWKNSGLDERWLRRGVMALAMTFGTFVMIYRILDGRGSTGESGAAAGLEALLYLAASVAFAAEVYTRKQDLFNFAVLALSWIVITTTLIARALLESNAGSGALFIIALYVIVASSVSVKGIAHLSRQWKSEGTPLEETAI